MGKSMFSKRLDSLERAARNHPLRTSVVGLAAAIALTAIVAGALALLIFARPSAAAQVSAKAAKTEHSESANVERGKKLYTTYGCYECHGRAAQGGVGPRLGPNPLSLAFIEKYVRHPTGRMPPYTKKTVSNQDLADIYAYLKTLPKPPNAKNIPLLNQ